MTLSSNDQIFLNCPFDDEYQPLFRAIVFTVFACGFSARTALELDDGGQTRIDKIYAIIGESRFGIHDISRTELDAVNGLPRFNMPLELGIFLGAKRFGPKDQKAKRCLVLDVDRYRFQKFISDIAGTDPKSHDGDPVVAIRKVRDWLRNVSGRQLPGHVELHDAWDRFVAELPEYATIAGLEAVDLSYADYVSLVVGWLAPSD